MYCSVMRIAALCIFIPFEFARSTAAESPNSLRVEGLRCEGRIEPLGIETARPVLSWKIASEGRGVVQKAYQILVASNEEHLKDGKADLWDSGRTESGSQQVAYGGTPLVSLAQAFWAVRVWTADGTVSPWSEPAQWTAGLSAGDWTAKWIERTGPELPIFRKTFTPGDKPIRRALALVCGLGQFELSINGAKVGDHFLDPAWTNYRKTCLYVPFDVTNCLRPGQNVLGVMLGNGMYNVAGERYTKFKGSFGSPKLILEMRVEYQDGTSDTIITDESWRVASSPITFSCIYGGEDYDARLEQPGWQMPGFDDSTWNTPHVVEGPGGVLRAQDSPPIRVAETLRAPSFHRKDPGEYFVDLGQNLSARPYLKVKGEAGAKVTVRVGELPDKPWPGHSYTYTLKGDGEEMFRPRFTYFGFQYLFISGADRPRDVKKPNEKPVLLDAGADFVTSSAPIVGSFHCDNELFNDIEAMINRSVRSNLQSVLTDCPHREKLGWLEVSHLMGPSIAYHFDVSGLYAKICRDTTESQLENGLVPDIAPEYTRFEGGFFESAEWGSACVQLPWMLYRWYGDEAILERQFDTVSRYTRYLASTRNVQGLAKGGLGDWYDWTPEKGHAGGAQLTPAELTATCMLYDNARILSEIGRILGRTVEEKEFGDLAGKVRDDFVKAYYDPAKKSVSTGSQSALACGLFFDFMPQEDRGAILENLVRAVEAMQYRPTTGEVCFRYMVRALADAGRSDVVYRIVDRTDPPGYGCMLRKFGLKTLSEQWDRPGSSLNHCMFGHIQEWFQGFVLGIRQADDSVGFERLYIAPTPVGNLKEAEGYYDSPRGRIAVHWRRKADAFELDLTIPGNTTAEVILPVAAGARITESRRPVQEAPGVIGVKEIDGKPVVTVGSGRYRFVGVL